MLDQGILEVHKGTLLVFMEWTCRHHAGQVAEVCVCVHASSSPLDGHPCLQGRWQLVQEGRGADRVSIGHSESKSSSASLQGLLSQTEGLLVVGLNMKLKSDTF